MISYTYNIRFIIQDFHFLPYLFAPLSFMSPILMLHKLRLKERFLYKNRKASPCFLASQKIGKFPLIWQRRFSIR